MTTAVPKGTETAPAETAAAPGDPARDAAPSVPVEKQASVSTPSATPTTKDNRIPTSGNVAPPPEVASQPTATLNSANGAAELAMAEDFLNGKTHPRNSEEAAKYLWRAVGKENPTAILLLSDMYQVGDGVPKSCDQARLLLSAAAKKGVPQAADKLRDLLRSGCPK
jgi:TPR repeat protein